jgi:MFS transporter, DHA1 family, multidrug resistance protein
VDAPQTLKDFSRGRRAAIVAILGGLWTIGPFSIDLYLPALPTLGGDLGAS